MGHARRGVGSFPHPETEPDPDPDPDPVRSLVARGSVRIRQFGDFNPERLNGTESLPTMRTERRCVDPPIHNVGGASLTLREHHRRASKQRTRLRRGGFEPKCGREIKDGDAFHRATAGNLVVPPLARGREQRGRFDGRLEGA